MRLFTSRYANPDLANRPDLVKVKISVGVPRGRHIGYRVEAQVWNLEPTWRMVQDVRKGIITREQYEVAYSKTLAELDIGFLSLQLEHIGRTNGNRDLVLLCFEDLRKPGAWCHRRMFADWWQKQTGEEVPELEEENHA